VGADVLVPVGDGRGRGKEAQDVLRPSRSFRGMAVLARGG
jgi:hypothetical protein